VPKSKEITIGMAGAAGDGLDRSGETLARTAARLGLHVLTYNSYQSLIRGGHTWLRLRLSEAKVANHGDGLNVLIALNQDSLERHVPEVESGGAVIFNGDKFECPEALLPDGVKVVPLPIKELTKDLGRIPPVMQNTVALGALLHLIGLDVEVMSDLYTETFSHKGEEVIDMNVGALRAGFDYAAKETEPLDWEWEFSRERRPVMTGNSMLALGAVSAGCRFYSAYPMSPASSILHWLAEHAERLGVVVKQAEDELAVINIAIGAGHAGVRAMCATSGGGFALMTEAIGMAGMLETPVVCVNVMRGGPSTGLPTKTEQGDLNQAIGASQGDFPRVIIAPRDAEDCFNTAVEAFNLAETFQLPVIVLSDLYLAEQRCTVDPDAISHDVPIERGEWVTEPEGNGAFRRYRITPSGVSPRARPGTKGTVHVSATDEHDEKGLLVSDEHTNAAIRRKMLEKRMRKMDGVLAKLPPPAVEGPEHAEATLIGWGSTWGVIVEAAERLAERGVPVNRLHFKYLWPFHESEALEILGKCERTIVIEANYSGQFARHLRAETGFTVDHVVTKYDGEPIEPGWLADRVEACIKGADEDLQVSEAEAREMAYHHVRIYMNDKARPGTLEAKTNGERDEPVWEVELVGREDDEAKGTLVIGRETGSVHQWQPAGEPAGEKE